MRVIYINEDGEECEIANYDELTDIYKNGTINKGTLVKFFGGNKWQPIENIFNLNNISDNNTFDIDKEEPKSKNEIKNDLKNENVEAFNPDDKNKSQSYSANTDVNKEYKHNNKSSNDLTETELKFLMKYKKISSEQTIDMYDWLIKQHEIGNANQKEMELAIALTEEEQLLDIVKIIQTNVDADRDMREALNIDKSQQTPNLLITDMLYTDELASAYAELYPDDIYILMPLFFSPDMKNEKSLYFKDANTRNAAFVSFKILIKKDGLKLEKLKERYKENSKHAEYLPLHEKIGNINTNKKN